MICFYMLILSAFYACATANSPRRIKECIQRSFTPGPKAETNFYGSFKTNPAKELDADFYVSDEAFKNFNTMANNNFHPGNGPCSYVLRSCADKMVNVSLDYLFKNVPWLGAFKSFVKKMVNELLDALFTHESWTQTNYRSSSSYSSSSSPKENETSVGDRIIGGRSVNSVPYLAALYSVDTLLCGSTLITNRYLITAAHCVDRKQVSNLWIRIGNTNLNLDGQIHYLSDAVKHPNYDTKDFDIAVIRSKTPVEFGLDVKKLRLPTPHDPDPVINSLAVASGYGFTGDSNRGPSLREVTLEIVSRNRCRKRIIASLKVISDNQICTLSSSRAGTCFGDSGGPLMANNKLIGVISWGSACAIGDPDVYTNVQKFLPWISSTMEALDGLYV